MAIADFMEPEKGFRVQVQKSSGRSFNVALGRGNRIATAAGWDIMKNPGPPNLEPFHP
jgi:hypothetical protein